VRTIVKKNVREKKRREKVDVSVTKRTVWHRANENEAKKRVCMCVETCCYTAGI